MNQGTAVVVAALVGALGAIGASTIPKLLDKPASPTIADSEVVLPDAKDEAKAVSGNWLILESGVVYKAESDGFVVIASGGTNPAKNVDILTGSSQGQMQTRARMGAVYSGTMAPVSKGEYWIARKWPNEEGGVDVQWKPAVGSVF